MSNPPKHSYEEVRGIAVDVLLNRQSGQFNDFLEDVGQTLLKKHGAWPPRHTGIAYPGVAALLHPDDSPLVLEVFWDMFRQGAITLGRDATQPGWPGCRLSRFGRQIAQQTPFRFHDTKAYIEMVKTYVPDVSPNAVAYLEEAIASFYADCLLASCVMLGVAAEAEFLRLVDVSSGGNYGTTFAPVSTLCLLDRKLLSSWAY